MDLDAESPYIQAISSYICALSSKKKRKLVFLGLKSLFLQH